MTQSEKELSEQAFEACFELIDGDKNGVIDKQEMMEFMKLATGLLEGESNSDGVIKVYNDEFITNHLKL